MKKKTSRILTLVLALALVIGATVAIAASAEGATAPTVISKNVAYEGNFSLMYAVDAATVAEAPVTLNLYYAAPAEGAAADVTYTAAAPQTITAGGAEYSAYVFKTAGVAAKDMGDVFYVQAVDAAGNKGEVVSYSVAEYMLERLYGGAEITAKQKLVYEKSLELGAAAQDLLTEGETLISDWRYVKGGEGVLVNGKSATVALLGEELTLSYVGEGGFNTWEIQEGGEYVNTLLKTEKAVAGGNYTFVASNSFRNTGAYAEHPNALDFDGVTAAELRDAGVIGTSSSYAAISLDEAAGNHATVKNSTFIFHKQASGQASATLAHSGYGDNMVLEFDFMIDPDFAFTSGGRSDQTVVQALGVNLGGGADWDFPSMNISYKDPDGDGTSGLYFGGFRGDVTDLEMIPGEWYSIRFEMGNMKAGASLVGYINGQKVTSEGKTFAGDAVIGGLCFLSQSEPRVTFHMDNLFFGDANLGLGMHADKSVSLEALEAISKTGEGSLSEGVLYEINNGVTLSEAGNNKVISRTGTSESVLYFTNNAATTSPLVLEFDLRLAGCSLAANRGIDLYLNQNQISKNLNWGNTKTVIIYDEELGSYVIKVGDAVARIDVNRWNNVRIEYTGVAANSAVKVYINNELVAIGALDRAVKVASIYVLTYASNSSGDSIDGTVQFDNIYVGVN